MPDIFLSYSRDDLPTARRFAEAFEREGFSVWWDQTLNPGEAFDEVTERALIEAKAVVVLWSKKSVASRWVRAEATQANDSKTLVPVMIEACKRPIMFELTHTADLSNWKGNSDDPAWLAYLAGVKRVVRKDAAAGIPVISPQLVQRRFGVGVLAGVVTLLLITGLGIWAVGRKGLSPATTSAPVPPSVNTVAAVGKVGKPRIAIMPFENLSPDPAIAFFTDGMHEEILSALANGAPDLEVLSRTTMMTYRGGAKTVAAIAKELNANYLLEGTMRRDGEDVRLTLELIDAKSDGQIWSQSFNRKLVKAMTLQSEVAEKVASQLSVKLTDTARRAAAPTSDPQAYDLYLKARLQAQLLAATGVNLAEWRKTEALLTEAIARDPNFALAYADRGDLRFNIFQYNLDTSEQQRLAARADLDTAERLRPKDPAWLPREAQWKWLDHDFPGALTLLSDAAAAGVPEPATVLVHQDILGRMGRYEEGLRLLDRAVALDPANTALLGVRSAVILYVRRPAEAIRAWQEAAERDSNYAPLAGLMVASTRFAYTGDTKAVEGFGDGPPLAQRDLRKGRRQAEAGPERTQPVFIANLRPIAIGNVPQRALDLGDLDLLLADPEAAARDGRAVLDFVAGEKVTRYNEWFLKVLTARGRMYLDDKKGALAATREALSLSPRSRDAVQWALTSIMTVDVLARCGASEEAASTLEQLFVAVPGLAPVDIRDQRFAVPLAGNSRFKALSTKLEAQMAATKLD